jgi:hypothetical protein
MGAIRGAVVAVAAAGLLSGCGLGAGAAPQGVKLTVTREFGSVEVHHSGALQVRGQETAMSLLMRNYAVQTQFGGGFVQSIDGLSGGTHDGAPVAWFYFVNGIEAPKGAAATTVPAGSRVWWDLRDWSATENVAAVVGSFPQPFLSGYQGKRLPVRVECTAEATTACGTVSSKLEHYGVPAAIGGVASGELPDTLRVLVGTDAALSTEGVIRSLAEGPHASGVYAHLSGGTLTALRPSGAPATQFGAGTGLIAAVSQDFNGPPAWVITGTDLAGVERAANALGESSLRNHFAVAVPADGGVVALPEVG